MNTKTLYFMTRIALAAVFAMGLILVPAFNSTGTVLAQRSQKGVETQKVDTQNITSQQIMRAVRPGAALDVSVFAENSIAQKGGSTVKGQVLSLTDGGEKALNVRKDFSDSFSAINQLACTDLADTDLTGKTLGPGVYCMASARLAGQLTLDGQGDGKSMFVFRVKGDFNVEKDSAVSVIGEAFASAVYFVADDSATIGEGANFKGNVYARNSVAVNDGTIVDGKVMSLKGDVSVGSNVILGPQQTGVLEICKRLDTTFGTGLEGRVFQFRIGGPNGRVEEALAGSCSRPILAVPAGPISVEELLTGRTTTGGSFNGGFQLIDVNPLGSSTEDQISNRNFPARTVTLTIIAGTSATQNRFEFVNRFAITAVIEICKEGLDTGVASFFNFSVAEILDSNGVPVTFTAPTGQCTGPLTVQVPSIDPFIVNNGTPRAGVVNVTESFQAGNIFAGGFTADGTVPPVNRFLGINLQTRTIRGIVVEGGVQAQTTFFFVNRTLSILKICKVGALGIPEFTPFTFSVLGTGPTLAPGVQGPDPGTLAATTITVESGTVERPVCREVSIPFLTGTGIQITELATNPGIVAGATDIRVSRISSSSGFTVTAGTAVPTTTTATSGATPQFTATAPALGLSVFPPSTGAASTRTVIVPAANQTTEVEFVNIPFAPVPIKICKIAGGAGTLQGTSFSFDATVGTTTLTGATPPPGNVLEDPSGVLPTTTTSNSVIAGPGGLNNGFCDFIAGPSLPTINGLGSFNLFAPVTITERAVAGTGVASIFTPTGGPAVQATLATRQGFIPQLVNGVNEITFINVPATAPIPNKTKRFRMQF